LTLELLASGLTDSAAYLYDHDSNRVAAAIGSVSTGYVYDRAGQLVSRVDGGSPTYFSYDRFGNQTQAAVAFNAVTAYAYDAADRLRSITPPGQGATTFALDALGRHATRTTGSLTDTYAYLGTTETVWQISTGASTLSAAREPSGALAALDAAGTDAFALADLHGNTAAVVNAADSAYLSATRYDAYGQTAATYDSGSSYWRVRPLSARYAYIWSDGIYLGAGLEPENSCLLVVVGAREDGRKELLAMELGYRESSTSWAGVLRGLRDRGLEAPLLPAATARWVCGPRSTRSSRRRATSAAGTIAS
jgi:YD repeat-containing protein